MSTTSITKHSLTICSSRLVTLFFVVWLSAPAQAQDHVYPPRKPTPPQISPHVFVLGDHVVQGEWQATLSLVNGPSDLTHVEVGQCIRFAVSASGDGRDELLGSAKFTFEFTWAGQTQAFGPESAHVVKQIKPEGGDFVTLALGAAGIKNPVLSLVSMAAPPAEWCAPSDIRSGTATILGTALLANGDTVQLEERKLDVRTFESARKEVAFTDINALGAWMQSYHQAPEPSRLLPGLRLVAADEQARSVLNIMAFFIAALKSSPVAAEEIIRKLPSEHPWTRIYALPLLREAGYPTESLMDGFTDKEKAVLLSVDIPDPFDIKPDRVLPQKMDMLWATFFATGRIKPVKTIISMLAWREDYDKFVKMRESGQKPTELTDSIMRGVVYTAAGWSLSALSRSDGLVADYIDVVKASPDTPTSVKAELSNLYTNAAFRGK